MKRVVWLQIRLAVGCNRTDSGAAQMWREEHVCFDWQEGRSLYRLCAGCCMRLLHGLNSWRQDGWLQITASSMRYPGREEILKRGRRWRTFVTLSSCGWTAEGSLIRQRGLPFAGSAARLSLIRQGRLLCFARLVILESRILASHP